MVRMWVSAYSCSYLLNLDIFTYINYATVVTLPFINLAPYIVIEHTLLANQIAPASSNIVYHENL